MNPAMKALIELAANLAGLCVLAGIDSGWARAVLYVYGSLFALAVAVGLSGAGVAWINRARVALWGGGVR